jgi:nondiscriminating glutamyl-tRNA synthetase
MAQNSKKIRTRFAPSPTGFVHIGSLRTALFAFLFARHEGGVNILRVEDTDQSRLVDGAIENLVKILHELGIEFDEGFYYKDDDKLAQKGDYGPYLQSERLDVYKKYTLELIDKGAAYYCFCDEKRLEVLRTEQTALKKPPMYDRLCRNLSGEEIKTKLAEFKDQEKQPVVRQAIPLDGQTVIHDLVYGDITYEHKVLDDQVLLKSDGFPTYHLAVVVDDHEMEITHAIRGEEWIPSTPKHILLYQAFGWEPTAFAHLPLILNPDKSKLSKRQGDVAVEDFLKKGYLKEALVNFVAFLGWNPKTEQEIFSLSELIEQFEFSKVNTAAPVFDINKLDWMNSIYIRNKPIEQLTQAIIPYWINDGYFVLEGDSVILTHLNKKTDKKYLESIVSLEQERLKKLSEIGERTPYFFKHPELTSVKEILVGKKSTEELTKQGLSGLIEVLKNIEDNNFNQENIETVVKKYITDSGLGNFDVLWPMRAALTGLSASPSPFEVAGVLAIGLGKNDVIDRLNVALTSLG